MIWNNSWKMLKAMFTSSSHWRAFWSTEMANNSYVRLYFYWGSCCYWWTNASKESSGNVCLSHIIGIRHRNLHRIRTSMMSVICSGPQATLWQGSVQLVIRRSTWREPGSTPLLLAWLSGVFAQTTFITRVPLIRCLNIEVWLYQDRPPSFMLSCFLLQTFCTISQQSCGK